jgi:hypothetical protein
MIRFARLTAFGCLLVAGCGGPANEYDAIVTGTVTIDGELAQSGTVTFQPVSKDGKIAIGRIHQDGSYSLRTGQGDLQQVDGGTVVSGDYIVTLSVNSPPVDPERAKQGSPPIPGPSLIASKYATKETSDLKQTVEPGPQVIVLELDRAAEVATDGEAATEGESTEEVVEIDATAETVDANVAPTTESNEVKDARGEGVVEQ